MRFFTPAKPRLDEPVSIDRTPAALAASVQRSGRITAIEHPATKYPLDHSVATADPHLQAEEYRDATRALVAGFAATGGFDEDNLEMLSLHISSWLEEWDTHANQVAIRRLETAETLVAQLVQNLAESTRDLAAAQQHRTELVNARDELLTTEFGFTPQLIVDAATVRADAQATATAERAAAEEASGASVIRALRASRAADRPADRGARPAAEPLPLGAVEPSPLPIRHTTGFVASTDTP
jgi:hypothetical protein